MQKQFCYQKRNKKDFLLQQKIVYILSLAQPISYFFQPQIYAFFHYLFFKINQKSSKRHFYIAFICSFSSLACLNFLKQKRTHIYINEREQKNTLPMMREEQKEKRRFFFTDFYIISHCSVAQLVRGLLKPQNTRVQFSLSPVSLGQDRAALLNTF